MRGDFKDYLQSLAVTKILSERIETIYQFYQDLGVDDITGIFITDYIQSDGTRILENLWFFSENFAMEAKTFPSQDDFDMTPLHGYINYWRIEKQGYDFIKAVDKSRLNIEFIFNSRITGTLKASKENCDYLKEIFLKYIAPNIRR